MTYEIKDIVTTQVYPNLTVREISEMLKVTEAHVYRAIRDNVLVGNRFKVIKRDEPTDKPNKLPQNLLIEWDMVTRKFKKFYGGAR